MTDFAPLLFADLAARATGRTDDPSVVRGHAAGYAAGRRVAEAEISRRRAELDADAARTAEESRRRLESALGALDAAAGLLDARTAPVLAAADGALVAAAVELAAAILEREPHPGVVAVVERALRVAGDAVPRRVRLHPADAAALADLAVEGLVPAGVEIVADPEVDAGGALLDLRDGEIDARLGAALDRARAALADVPGAAR